MHFPNIQVNKKYIICEDLNLGINPEDIRTGNFRQIFLKEILEKNIILANSDQPTRLGNINQ